MKKFISLVLAGIMTFSLAACGQNATANQTAVQNQSTANEENAANEAADTAESAATASTDSMELTMYFPVAVGGGPDALIDALCSQYHEENPNITIKPVYAGSYADTRTKVQAAIKAGNTPDMAIMFSIDLYSLLAMDAIADIDSFCTTDADKEWLNGFYDGFMMNSRDGETTYGIPWQRSTIVLYYNKEAFQEAGLDPEKAPSTWDELKEDAKKLTKADGSQYGIEIPSDGYAYWMLQTFCNQQSGFNLMNNTGTEVYYNDERTAKGLEFWKSLAEDGSMPTGIVAWATTPSDFIEGKQR